MARVLSAASREGSGDPAVGAAVARATLRGAPARRPQGTRGVDAPSRGAEAEGARGARAPRVRTSHEAQDARRLRPPVPPSRAVAPRGDAPHPRAVRRFGGGTQGRALYVARPRDGAPFGNRAPEDRRFARVEAERHRQTAL